MIFVGADPGDKSPFHASFDSETGIVSFSQNPFPRADIVLVESQYLNPHKPISKAAYGTLRFSAGILGGWYLCAGAQVWLQQPKKWRELVLPGSAEVNKIVLHNRAQRAGFFDDVPFPHIEITDERDAYLILMACIMQYRKAMLKPQDALKIWGNKGSGTCHTKRKNPRPRKAPSKCPQALPTRKRTLSPKMSRPLAR